MILVTVGTHGRGFDRLVAAMDALAGRLAEPVIIQRGSSRYLPRHAGGFGFAGGELMAELTGEARVVVAHAAAGTILTALKLRKPLVVVPRLRRYGEHNDDHQLQLARALHTLGAVVAVAEPTPETLAQAIALAGGSAAAPEGPARLVGALRGQLELWESSAHRAGE